MKGEFISMGIGFALGCLMGFVFTNAYREKQVCDEKGGIVVSHTCLDVGVKK